MKEERQKVITRHITLTPSISERVDKYCKDEERARSWVIQKAIDEWLKKKGY
jgi:predicted transcriptional regulator